MIKVSVIVPVYNVEKYIVKCINSLIKQKLKEIEIIIVNDGTKDNSIKLIEENFNDDRIKIYNKKNGGAAAARNFAIKKAKGEYLFFVDGDDFIENNCLYDMYNKAQKDKVGLVICDYYKYFETGEKEHVSIIPFFEENNKKCSVIAMPGPVCKLIERQVVIENNISFLENHIFEDNAIMPYLCALFDNFSYIKKPYYYYVHREGSALHQQKYNQKWEDIFPVLEHLYKKFNDKNLVEKYYEELEYIYIEYLLHAANLKFIDYKKAHFNIKRVSEVMKNKFPNWRKNYYYKKSDLKYKVMLNLFFYNQIKIIKLLRRIS